MTTQHRFETYIRGVDSQEKIAHSSDRLEVTFGARQDRGSHRGVWSGRLMAHDDIQFFAGV